MQKFGLDKPLLEQYFDYIGSLARFDLGVSLNQYPKTVLELIMEALPWTIGLLLVTTILVVHHRQSAWARSPRGRERPAGYAAIATPFVLFNGVPPVLMGVLLFFFIAFRLKLLPLGGAYSIGIVPDWSLELYLWTGSGTRSCRRWR